MWRGVWEPQRALVRMAKASPSFQDNANATKALKALRNLWEDTWSQRYHTLVQISQYLRKQKKEWTLYKDLDQEIIQLFNEHRDYFEIKAFDHKFTYYKELEN